MPDLTNEELRATRILNGVIAGDKVYTEKEIEETIDKYINSLLENLDDDRRWCDIELVDNFKQLKKDLLGK